MWLQIGSLYNNSSKEEIKHAFNAFFVGSSKSAIHVYGMVSCNLSPVPLFTANRGLPSLGQELCQKFRQCCSVEFLNTDPFSSALIL